MSDPTTTRPLSEVIRHDTLGLLRIAMEGIGPATQTLAAVRRLASKSGETFASIRVISDVACLPMKTTQRQLTKLIGLDWLKSKGRRGRRTPTLVVPMSLLNRSSERKFAMLPRWAASLLPTWSQRAVFACIISRDTLCTEVLDDSAADHGECYGRRVYTLSSLQKDTGLGRPAIIAAKLALVEHGLITIDPAMDWRDDLGRIRTFGDTLFLNPDFAVDASLLARPVKAVAKPTQYRKRYPNHRGKKMSQARSQSEVGGGNKMSFAPVTKWGLQLREPLKEILKRTTESTPPLAKQGPCGVDSIQEEPFEEARKPNAKAIDPETIAQRKQRAKEQLQATLAAESVLRPSA